MHPTLRDGPACFTDNSGSAPNYWPNSFSKVKSDPRYKEHSDNYTGDVQRFDTSNDDNFEQVTAFWKEVCLISLQTFIQIEYILSKVLTAEERDRLVSNIAGHLKDAQQFIQERAVQNFEKVHPDFGAKLRLSLNLIKVRCIDK